MAHSLAPFTVEHAEHLGDPAYAIRCADGDLIAVGCVKGDADLFAAAPDLLEALQRSAEGWANAIELGLLPPQHVAAATILRDEARAALSKALNQAPEDKL